MKIEILNRSSERIPRSFLLSWSKAVAKELRKRGHKNLNPSLQLTLVFVDEPEGKKLNLTYRSKNRATDVLSFEALEPNSLGELVLCTPVLKTQAKEHDLSFRFEVGYMLLHGVLHLLGYDHEKGKAEAEQMFQLQDEIFDCLIARAKDF